MAVYTFNRLSKMCGKQAPLNHMEEFTEKVSPSCCILATDQNTTNTCVILKSPSNIYCCPRLLKNASDQHIKKYESNTELAKLTTAKQNSKP